MSVKYFKEINSCGAKPNEIQNIYLFEVGMHEEEHQRNLIRYIRFSDNGKSYKCDIENDPDYEMRDQGDYTVCSGDFFNDTIEISELEFNILWSNVDYLQ